MNSLKSRKMKARPSGRSSRELFRSAVALMATLTGPVASLAILMCAIPTIPTIDDQPARLLCIAFIFLQLVIELITVIELEISASFLGLRKYEEPDGRGQNCDEEHKTSHHSQVVQFRIYSTKVVFYSILAALWQFMENVNFSIHLTVTILELLIVFANVLCMLVTWSTTATLDGHNTPHLGESTIPIDATKTRTEDETKLTSEEDGKFQRHVSWGPTPIPSPDLVPLRSSEEISKSTHDASPETYPGTSRQTSAESIQYPLRESSPEINVEYSRQNEEETTDASIFSAAADLQALQRANEIHKTRIRVQEDEASRAGKKQPPAETKANPKADNSTEMEKTEKADIASDS